MNMGGPGDHWITDIVSWDRPAFGEPTDTLIKDVLRLGGHAHLRDDQPLARRLSDLWPRWGRVDEVARERLAADLASLPDELRRDAIARGWEVE
jgi:hypothetical protein